MSGIELRIASPDDADSLARLHASSVTEGFLPTLGIPFLRLLHRRIARSSFAFSIVGLGHSGVVGMLASTESVRTLYREFLVRDGLQAGVLAFPRLVKAVPRAVETLRYPTGNSHHPSAEILVVAVSATARGQGVGHDLLRRALTELESRGVPTVQVVTTAGNEAALALYRSAGFRTVDTLEVHRGTTSVRLERKVDEGSR